MDDRRDAERARWNEALATGNRETIDRVADELLVEVHTRIMDDEPNYGEAGWG